MATLPRRQTGNRLPEYKDYVNFVSAYRNGKKEEDVVDDDQPIVLTINTGAESPEPDTICLGSTCKSYSEFLGKTKHKKFGPVKPPIVSRETTNWPAKKTVKTEIFLEINNESVGCQSNAYSVGKAIRQFENHGNGQCKELKRTQSNSSVEARKKLFEEKSTSNSQLPKVSSPSQHHPVQETKTEVHHVLNRPLNPPSADTPNIITVNGNKKIFDQLDREIHEYPDNITHITPVTILTKKIIDTSSSNSHNSNDSFSRDITKMFLDQERTTNCEGFDRIYSNSFGSQNVTNPRNNARENLIQQLSKTITKTELLQVNKTNEEKTIFVERAPVTNCGIINLGSPPPPPPMPIIFSDPTVPRILRISPSTTIQKQTKDDHPVQKNISLQPSTIQSANVVDGSPTSNNRKYSTVDRKDPLVRKLAYNAMLDMYGAYHNKANNYVAALPQHQVKKENSLQKIIDNIAAQGGLEKLSGRINPKAENE